MFADFINGMKNSNRYVLLLGLFYFIAHGGILLIPNAIYWDDWVLYRTDPSVILDTFKQAGSMFNIAGYLHIALLEVGPWSYKYLTFILMFASGLLLNTVIKRHSTINEKTRFLIVLLFLILPFNLARVALIDFGYTLCYFLFFLAWVLMDRFRILALALFFLSFNTNSLLVFYAVPFFDLLYRGGYLSSWKSTINFGMRHIDYILLPFVYFYIKVHYFLPSGFYSGYNESYNIKNLIDGPLNQFLDLSRQQISVGLAGLFSVVAFYILRRNVLVTLEKERFSITLFVVGVLVFILGAFPYWIVGHVPSFTEWTSRHQLLLPLGFALIIIGAWSNLGVLSVVVGLSRAFNLCVLSVVVGLSLAFNVSTYKDFFIDWQKQQQLIQLFSANPEIKNTSLIVIDDRTVNMNAIGRSYRFYEWNGIFELAFGDEKRFGITERELPHYLAGKYDNNLNAYYKAGSFKKNSQIPPIEVEINLLYPRSILKNKVFPQFTIAVTKASLNEIK
jgi:hypothetical protein